MTNSKKIHSAPRDDSLVHKIDAEAATLLTRITSAGGIYDMGMFAFSFDNFTDLIRDNLLVIHRAE